MNELVVPREDIPGYLAPALTGIWARAPYLHSGSVSTLHYLLISEARPLVFQLNDFSYDEKLVGFNWEIKDQGDDPVQDKPGQSKGQAATNHVVRFDTNVPRSW